MDDDHCGYSSGHPLLTPVPEASRAYRIGFLNPWNVSAENQSYASMRLAGERLGHEIVYCTTSAEIEAAQLDFVVAASTYQPKLTNTPTLINLHEGRTRFWDHPDFFRNFLSYDGYLTISDSLARFARSMTAGLDRFKGSGFFYIASQIVDLVCDLEDVIAKGQLKVCYFGTNWDLRARALFLALSEKDYTRIQGPEASWAYLEGRQFFGPLPFDGLSVQRTYAEHGIGLVLLSREHLVDDVISNRLFEIASVGAVAICPRIPWVVRNFGDSVFYYDTTETDLGIANQVEEAVQAILADPPDAARRAREARRIFETQFSVDVLLPQAITHYEAWKADRARRLASLPAAKIDVVMRAGGRPIEMLRRALDSIDGQRTGRFRIVLVLYAPIDIAPLLSVDWDRIDQIEVVHETGGNRAATLLAGLKRVESDLFAILDDDDFWLDHHIETLLAALIDAGDRGLAVSGMITADSGAEPGMEARKIRYLDAPTAPIQSVLGNVGIHTFLASRPLLRIEALEGWDMETGEDTALIGSLLVSAEVRYTHRPTAVQTVGRADQSNFAVRPDRAEDLLQAYLRIGPAMEEVERRLARPMNSYWETGRRFLELAQVQARASVTQPREPVPMLAGRLTRPLAQRKDVVARRIDLEAGYLGIRTVRKRDEEGLPANESWFDEPWLFGLVARMDDHPDFKPDWLVAKLDQVSGPIAALHLDLDNGEVLVRDVTLAGLPDVEFWLPVDRAGGVFVLQCWSEGLGRPAILRELWAVQASEPVARTAPLRGGFENELERERELAGRREAVAAFLAEELAWSRSLPRPIISHDRVMIALNRRTDLSTSAVGLDAEVVSIPLGGGADLPDGRAARILMDPIATPRQDAVRVDLRSLQISRADWVVVEIGRTMQVLPFHLLDEAGHTLRTVEAPAGRDSVELWLQSEADSPPATLVLRHPERPLEDAVLLRRVTIARPARGR